VCERIPYLILPVRQLSREPFGSRRSAASEPSGMTPGPSRIEPSAEAQIRRSAASELSGKTPGPSRSEPSAEAPRASRRAHR